MVVPLPKLSLDGRELAEGVVAVAGDDVATGIHQRHHIAVPIVDVIVARRRCWGRCPPGRSPARPYCHT